jgi:hypothetical protein
LHDLILSEMPYFPQFRTWLQFSWPPQSHGGTIESGP